MCHHCHRWRLKSPPIESISLSGSFGRIRLISLLKEEAEGKRVGNSPVHEGSVLVVYVDRLRPSLGLEPRHQLRVARCHDAGTVAGPDHYEVHPAAFTRRAERKLLGDFVRLVVEGFRVVDHVPLVACL